MNNKTLIWKKQKVKILTVPKSIMLNEIYAEL